jgi:hypothetical protein
MGLTFNVYVLNENIKISYAGVKRLCHTAPKPTPFQSVKVVLPDKTAKFRTNRNDKHWV